MTNKTSEAELEFIEQLQLYYNEHYRRQMAKIEQERMASILAWHEQETAKAVAAARLDQMNYVDQRLIGKNTSGDRVFYDKDAVIAENKLKDYQRIISDAMKAELQSQTKQTEEQLTAKKDEAEE